MQIHTLYKGPMPDEGIKIHKSEGLCNIVNDDIITKCHTLSGSIHKTIHDSQIHNTAKGPVLSLTKIEPTKASDGRTCTMNHTIFVSLSEVIHELSPFLDFPLTDLPLQPIRVKVEKEE